MPTVYLLRHAKSDWDVSGLDDRDRPLTAGGREAAAKLGAHLRQGPARPQLVVCSPALRARETLDLVAPGLGVQARVRVDESIYGASASQLWQLVRDLPDAAGEVVVIGHNPGLHDLAIGLVEAGTGEGGDADARDRLRNKLPTCALVTFAWPAGSWHELRKSGATLRSYLRPRDL